MKPLSLMLSPLLLVLAVPAAAQTAEEGVVEPAPVAAAPTPVRKPKLSLTERLNRIGAAAAAGGAVLDQLRGSLRKPAAAAPVAPAGD